MIGSVIHLIINMYQQKMKSYLAEITFLLPGGAGSKILVCISLGKAEYTGRIINSGTSGPRDFILS